MAIAQGKTPAERNKMIIAIVLGAIAFIALAYMFLGSSSSTKTSNANSSKKTTQTTSKTGGSKPIQSPDELPSDERLGPIRYELSLPPVPETL